MTVRELKAEISRLEKEYGSESLDWEVYTEQCTEGDKEWKRDPAKQGWSILDYSNDHGAWEYFKAEGFGITKLPKDKAIAICVNY